MNSLGGKRLIHLAAVTSVLLLSLLTVRAIGQGSSGITPDDNDLWRSEAANIRKIEQLTATQHTAILFTIDRMVGYSAGGTTRRLDLTPLNSFCPYPSPTLSHDGRFVAFISGETAQRCKIALFEIATGTTRPLLDLPYNPGELSWSWGDSEIAFYHASSLSPSIQSVTVQDGSTRTRVISSQLSVDGVPFGLLLDFVGAVQWAHAENKLLVGLTVDVPTRQPNAYDVDFRIELATDGILSKFATGNAPAVSPIADEVAWYSGNKIVAAHVDSAGQRVLTGPPRFLGIIPEGLGGRKLTWSPDGKQMFFGDIVSETCRDDVYLLQVETGRRKRFLHNSCVTILDWR